MDKFTHKVQKTTPNAVTYSYYLSPDFHNRVKDTSLPVLLICHGFPDNASMWSGALPKLLQLPYPIVLIDILGLGDSDKPTDATLYNWKNQASSIAQILDHEGVKRNPIIPIGHDWGSGVVQHFYLYNRDRCIGLSLLSLAYQVPSSKALDFAELNRETKEQFKYPGGAWEYWLFFTRPDAAKLMESNLERFYEAMHGNFPSDDKSESANPISGQAQGRDIWMRELFCSPSSLPHDGPDEPKDNKGMGSSALYDYIARKGNYESYTVDLKPYAKNPQLKEHLISRWRKEGLAGAVQYYNMMRYDTNLEDERTLCPETSSDGKDHRKITVPLLYIGCTGDWVCRWDQMKNAKEQGLLDEDDLEEKIIDSGHWLLYEQPEQVADMLVDWLQRKFPVSG